MARREITGRTASPDLIDDGDQPPPRLGLSIPDFCKAFSISEDFFYKLKRQGKAPRQMKVGARTLISMEAADEWRAEREAAFKAEEAAAKAKREAAKAKRKAEAEAVAAGTVSTA